MRPDDINRWVRSQPFQPFRILLSNGKSYDIRHPELVMVGRTHLAVGVPAEGFAFPVFDRQIDVALLHINTIEPLPSSTSPASN